jgi:hypothetical protein
MCQDLMVPAKNAVALLEYIDKNFPFYPTGFCLMKPEPRSDLQCNGIEADLLVNIGVYGKRITPHAAFVQANRYIESTLKKLGVKNGFMLTRTTRAMNFGASTTKNATKKFVKYTMLPICHP